MKAPLSGGRGRRVAALAGAAAIGLGLLLGVGPASASSGAAPGTPPPPPQMHQLDFLLGRWKCVVTVAFPGTPVTVNDQIAQFQPVLGGHWYEATVLQLPSASLPERLSFRWDFGYNPVDSTFTGYYYDDHSGQGNSTSAGLQDGHFRFLGTYSSGGYQFINQDDFQSIDLDHFVDHFSVGLDPAELIPTGTSDCHRIR